MKKITAQYYTKWMGIFLSTTFLTQFSLANSNLPSSQNPSTIINYNTPIRAYTSCSTQYNMVYERDIHNEQDQRSWQACKALEKQLDYILTIYPSHTTAYFKTLKYVMLVGEDAQFGGKASGLRYVRPNEPSEKNLYDQRWQNALIVYSSKNYLYLDDLWQIKSVAHELAHAWHIKNWAEKHPPILSAWQNALNQQLYLNVDDYKGRKILKAYALQNQLEYFAEISAAYFFKINYYPYDLYGLQSYDPQGYALVQSLWQE